MFLKPFTSCSVLTVCMFYWTNVSERICNWLIVNWLYKQLQALESSVQPHCDGLRRVMTSFRPSWRECGTHEHPSYYDVDFETGSSCVAPRDLLTAKMTSFGRRIRELQSSSSDGCLVSAASSAYHRWSTAIETERRRDRVTGVGHSGRPHAEGMYDDVHAWLIDTLDTAVQHASVLACDLATGLSLTMSTDHYSSLYRSFMDVQTLLRRVTNSLQLTHHQQVRRSTCYNLLVANTVKL